MKMIKNKHIRRYLYILLVLLITFTQKYQTPLKLVRTQNINKKAVINDGKMDVHFVDVGQGTGTLVRADGQSLVYDGGSRRNSQKFIEYLKEQGITTIDYMISSHYDEDHLGGLIDCLNEFEVKNVICSDYTHNSNAYRDFINGMANKKITPQHPNPGMSYTFGKGAFTVLGPNQINPNNSNQNSIVIRLDYGENSFIFTGDADHNNESKMIAAHMPLDCDVLNLGHHGSGTATSWDFLKATTPEYAVISCGKGNAYGHPHQDPLDKLSDMDIPVFRTDIQGDIVCTSDGKKLQWHLSPCNDYSSPGDTRTNPSR